MQNLISIHDLDRAQIQEIFDLAADLKARQRRGEEHRLLAGKTLAMIFEKPSTRTRVSFETGIYQLGGQPLVLTPGDTQLGRGETVGVFQVESQGMRKALAGKKFGDGFDLGSLHVDRVELLAHLVGRIERGDQSHVETQQTVRGEPVAHRDVDARAGLGGLRHLLEESGPDPRQYVDHRDEEEVGHPRQRRRCPQKRC